MRLSVRTKLLLATVAIISIAVVVSGIYLSTALRHNLRARVETELLRHTKIATLFLETNLPSSKIEIADSIADQLGDQMGFRVTIVTSGGRVIGDSELDISHVRTIENHKSRPEIQDALHNGTGTSYRYSTTIGSEMIYTAAFFSNDHVNGVVRVSKPLKELDEALGALYRFLIVGAAISVALALLMNGVFSYFFTRALTSIIEYSRRIAEGHRTDLNVSAPHEFWGLESSVRKLSDKLKRRVDELAMERDRFEAVLEGMSEAVLALDENRRVTVINSAALLLLGLGNEPIGQTLLETIRIPDFNLLLNDLEPGKSATSEFTIGVDNPRKVLARAVRQQSKAYVVVLLDVTELRRLENVRRDFVSNVSHELRTPISIVRANAETLLEGALEDQDAASRFLRSIVANAERLTNLIADLLDISRIEEGKLSLKKTPLNLSLALRRAASALETKAMEKEFSIFVEPCSDMSVLADAKALDQVLYNLLDNAVKYAEKGGTVVLRGVVENEQTIRIEVEDNGPGVPLHHQDRLFERFYRVDKGRSREMGGTGLGLAIVKHLVLAMGGRVGLRPGNKKGCIFWVELENADA